MSNCCNASADATILTCPQNQNRGRPVQLVTLKSLLTPAALARLEPQQEYRFCDSLDCPVVYFSHRENTFTTQDLKVPVFQKDCRDEVLVCYCFGWSRQRLQEELASTSRSTAIESIAEHIQAKRCGCEVNNPQGSCCLANVKRVLQTIQQACDSFLQ